MKEYFLKIICMLFLFPTPLFAEIMENKGLAIAREAEKRNNGFGNFTADLKMILKNKHGEESVRHTRNKTIEVPGDGDKILTIFDNPKDLKGTVMLTVSHNNGIDDQWLYLPELKRIKRISSSNKSGSFMGSEFAYEDISSEEVKKYTYRYLGEKPCPGEEFKGITCVVSERYPTNKKSGYTMQVEWKDKDEYRQVKIDFYDRKKSLFKTLIFLKYQLFIDTFWKAREMLMINHQSGKSTVLYWNNLQFKTRLTEKEFTKNALKRIR